MVNGFVGELLLVCGEQEIGGWMDGWIFIIIKIIIMGVFLAVSPPYIYEYFPYHQWIRVSSGWSEKTMDMIAIIVYETVAGKSKSVRVETGAV